MKRRMAKSSKSEDTGRSNETMGTENSPESAVLSSQNEVSVMSETTTIVENMCEARVSGCE